MDRKKSSGRSVGRSVKWKIIFFDIQGRHKKKNLSNILHDIFYSHSVDSYLYGKVSRVEKITNFFRVNFQELPKSIKKSFLVKILLNIKLQNIKVSKKGKL